MPIWPAGKAMCESLERTKGMREVVMAGSPKNEGESIEEAATTESARSLSRDDCF